MTQIRTLLSLSLCLLTSIASAQDADKTQAAKDQAEKLPTIASKVEKLQKIDGYMPLYWQPSAGKLFMEIGRFNQEMLYQVSLPAGLGSNPVGLDRGQLGDSSVVTFERIGPKVLMTQPNYSYRAISSSEPERRAVKESFAQSVLWGFKVEAEEADRVLVDATSFFMRDAHRVVDRLRQAKQGRYRLDDSRSALYLPRTKGFPQNTEIETTLTFTTDEDPGRYIRQTTPTPTAVTLREHHSFVQLPDLKYTPRKLDPRAPSFGVLFYDYASPINEPVEKRWIQRHRLEKKDPHAAISEPIKPIVYYVDNGAPEPIRTALIEGASWWNQAFEAAGFRNAFQVKVLPADADPMDVRYNMINWVHRATRGWSYGGGIADPRTGLPGFGEIVTTVVQRTWSGARPADGYGIAIQEAVQTLVVQRLMELAADTQATSAVRANASAGLRRIRSLAAASATAHAAGTREDITRFLMRPAEPFKKTDPLATPAGEPIGSKGSK